MSDELTPVVIRLKKKYTRGGKTRYGINGDHQGNNKRHKIGLAKHEARFGPQRNRTMVVKGEGGSTVMVDTNKLDEYLGRHA